MGNNSADTCIPVTPTVPISTTVMLTSVTVLLPTSTSAVPFFVVDQGPQSLLFHLKSN